MQVITSYLHLLLQNLPLKPFVEHELYGRIEHQQQ